MVATVHKLGDRFGYWTLLRRLPPIGTSTRWRCRCACGLVKDVYATNLTSGNSLSCGSCGARRRALRAGASGAIQPLRVAVGQVYHDWTVLEVRPVVNRQRLANCRCACGAEQLVFAPSLRNGRSRQCRACATRRQWARRRGEGE